MNEDQNVRQEARAADRSDSTVVTASERVLAWILAGFVLIALSWMYVNIDDAVRDARGGRSDASHQALRTLEISQEKNERELGLWDELSATSVEDARISARRAEDDSDEARDRYRTELEAGNGDQQLRRAYLAAERRAEMKAAELSRLESDRTEALEKQSAYMKSTSAQRRSARQRVASRQDATDRWIFFFRALLVLGSLALSVFLLRLIAERSPRAQPLAQAMVMASALLALAMIVDYSEISFDFDSLGPLGLAALGSAITIGAFFGLQRYLARRRPLRRLRAGECRRCGYPTRDVAFCEGCGSRVYDTCRRCGQPRRTGTPHCRSCGAV